MLIIRNGGIKPYAGLAFDHFEKCDSYAHPSLVRSFAQFGVHRAQTSGDAFPVFADSIVKKKFWDFVNGFFIEGCLFVMLVLFCVEPWSWCLG